MSECNCAECINTRAKKSPKSGEPKTQKARGIMRGLPQLCQMHGLTEFRYPQHYLIQDETQARAWEAAGKINFFARPCPQFPRHGFVESRPVKSIEEIKTLLEEVLKEDPNGELLLGQAHKHVTHNAIYTDFGSLSIGPGNDGATAGKGSMQLTVAPSALDPSVRHMSGMKSEDGAYFEVIYCADSNGGHAYPNLVQVRGGPVINAAERDFIPHEVTVSNVVIPDDDLLVWAKRVESFAPGTVVWADGHTLASHAAVHCIIHKIAFITSRQPSIGEKLAPSANAAQIPLSRDDFKRGVMVGSQSLKFTTSHMKDAFIFSLSVLHNWAYLRNTEHAAYLLGAAVALLEKICSSLCIGEYRHTKDSDDCGESREKVYEKAMSSNNFNFIKKLKEAFDSFHKTKWKSGFGGDPWAMCAFYSIRLWNAASKVYNKGTKSISDQEVASIMDTFNGMINLSHNNGWWFNKIAAQGVLDMAAQMPGFSALHSAKTYLDVCEYAKSAQLIDKLPDVKMREPFFMDKSKGACSMYITTDRPSWITFKTQKGFKRSTKIELTDKQNDALRDKLSKSPKGRVYLTPVKNGTFKLGNRVFNPPCKLEAAT